MQMSLVQKSLSCERAPAFRSGKCSHTTPRLRFRNFCSPSALKQDVPSPSSFKECQNQAAAQSPIQLNEPGSDSPITWMKSLMTQKPSRVQGLVMLNVMTLLMGSNWVVVKSSEQAMDPFMFAALRFTLAAIALSPALPEAMKDREVMAAGAELGLYAVLGYLAQSEALFYTDASRASLLSTITVLAVPVIARMAGHKIKPIVWICGVGTLIGTAMLEQSGTPPNCGDVLAVASAIFFALQMFRTEVLTRTLKAPSPFPLAAATLATIAVVSCGAAGWHAIPDQVISTQIAEFGTHASQIMNQIAHIGQPPPPPPSPLTQLTSQVSQLPAYLTQITSQISSEIAELPARVAALPAHLAAHPPPYHPTAEIPPAIQYIRSLPWGALLYTSICSTNVVILIEMLALHTVSSTEAAMIYTMEPVEGALMAYWLLGERWGMLGWAGAAIIVSCALATQIGGAEDSPTEGEAAP